jgi:hypothetical protein
MSTYTQEKPVKVALNGVDTPVHSRSTISDSFGAGGEHAHKTSYAAYVERLKREHERKASFWSRVP